MYFSPPTGSTVVPRQFEGIVFLFSWVFASIGCLAAISFIERAAASHTEDIYGSKLWARAGKSRGKRTKMDTTTSLALWAASFCLAINSIWLMHYLAMTAVSHNDRETVYDVPLTIISMLAVFILASVAIFHVGAHEPLLQPSPHNGHLLPRRLRTADVLDTTQAAKIVASVDVTEVLSKLSSPTYLRRLALGAVSFGTGVFLMHFLGMMAAMIEDAVIVYDLGLVLVTWVVAFVGTFVVLLVLFATRGMAPRLLISCVVGAAVLGVHTTGYFATTTYHLPGGAAADAVHLTGVEASGRVMVVYAAASASVVRYALTAVSMVS